MLTEKQKLESLINLGIELNQIKDLDILMEHILGQARFFVNADAGSIYIREDKRLIFSYTQNETLQKRLSPGAKLPYAVYSLPIDTNSIAGYSAHTGETLNIPDAYCIDESVCYRFGRSFDEEAGYRTQSILTIPLKNLREDVIGILQIINARDGDSGIVPFAREDERFLKHFAAAAAVALERAQLTRSIILRTIKMAEMRDPKETGPHVNRVASYAVELYEYWANRRGLPEKDINAVRDTLRMAAMLHDVGKVAISDAILKKPAKLTDEEYAIMKTHTIRGAELFRDKRSELDDAAAEVALNHHEFWNGKGYPGIALDTPQGTEVRGKRQEEIPLFGRIVAICDVYDALMSRRSYKGAWDESQALKILQDEAGRQFDPELVEIFLTASETFRAIRARYPEE
jgi:HD-GYP domain-containing protein (c-di-GMP phosphodiesterase class II)